jgi:hypothetical protein
MCLPTPMAVAFTPIGEEMMELDFLLIQRPEGSTSWKTM